ncbi:MAG: protein translocase subunit SecF [Gemmatimonadota bacterium]
MLRILHDTKIDFIKRWRLVGVIVLTFLMPALVWITVSTFGGGVNKAFRLGIEFTGGAVVQVAFKQDVNIADVRQTVTAVYASAEVQNFGSPRDLVVRAQGREAGQAESPEAVSNAIRTALRDRFGEATFTVVRWEGIGPRVGAEMRRNAVIAMLISFAVTLLYLAWRFDARLAVAAVAANVHDIIATFAFIKYMQIEISLFVVGGILTVIGYSLADKVVVFDRVRELLRKGARAALTDTLNLAINETLPRTVMTGSTVIACLISLIGLGGEVLRPFAMVLLFGIVIGTFSSIYVASPFLLLIERQWPRHDGETKGMSRALAEQRKRDDKIDMAAR